MSSVKGWKWSDVLYKLPNGEHLYDYCKRVNISYNTVLNRVYETGISIEESIKLTKERKGNHALNAKYFYEGMRVTEACKKYNVNKNKIYRDILVHKMSCDEAFDKEIKEKLNG